mmetsp:Transcript_29578/g.70943  ORF Transcript_29578/g.70943 Transcript_29578/m.70943 type:complete len:620 (+) Transcript_29578:64-1923(+)
MPGGDGDTVRRMRSAVGCWYLNCDYAQLGEDVDDDCHCHVHPPLHPPSAILAACFEGRLLRRRLDSTGLQSVPGFEVEFCVQPSVGGNSRIRIPLQVFIEHPDKWGSEVPLQAYLGACSVVDVVAPPGIRVPLEGSIQLTLMNPSALPFRIFRVAYDMTAMPKGSKTFVRQVVTDDADAGEREWAVQLHFVSPSSGRVYVYGIIRMMFHHRIPCGKASEGQTSDAVGPADNGLLLPASTSQVQYYFPSYSQSPGTILERCATPQTPEHRRPRLSVGSASECPGSPGSSWSSPDKLAGCFGDGDAGPLSRTSSVGGPGSPRDWDVLQRSISWSSAERGNQRIRRWCRGAREALACSGTVVATPGPSRFLHLKKSVVLFLKQQVLKRRTVKSDGFAVSPSCSPLSSVVPSPAISPQQSPWCSHVAEPAVSQAFSLGDGALTFGDGGADSEWVMRELSPPRTLAAAKDRDSKLLTPTRVHLNSGSAIEEQVRLHFAPILRPTSLFMAQALPPHARGVRADGVAGRATPERRSVPQPATMAGESGRPVQVPSLCAPPAGVDGEAGTPQVSLCRTANPREVAGSRLEEQASVVLLGKSAGSPSGERGSAAQPSRRAGAGSVRTG